MPERDIPPVVIHPFILTKSESGQDGMKIMFGGFARFFFFIDFEGITTPIPEGAVTGCSRSPKATDRRKADTSPINGLVVVDWLPRWRPVDGPLGRESGGGVRGGGGWYED